MTVMTALEAINAAMAWELSHDDDVVLLGEDVGTTGGIFRASQGLAARFGPDRVIDTPLDESGIVAHAIGMALYGMKPIAEINSPLHHNIRQIMFCGSKYRWITAGQYLSDGGARPSYSGIKGDFWHSRAKCHYVHRAA
jgi:pyruvate/2-oxoglutarate/acetoin dehydrogenase E1 component